MLNLINNLLSYFGYKILGFLEIEDYESNIKYRDGLISLYKESVNKLESNESKIIDNYETSLDNKRVLIEELTSDYKDLKEMNDNLLNNNNTITIKYKELIKTNNVLRANLASAVKSRDSYREKNKTLIGKLALVNCVHNKKSK